MTDPDHPNGYCYVLDVEGGWNPVLMADLRPGDVFAVVPEAGLFNDVVMHPTTPLQQAQAVLKGLLRRAKRYRFIRHTEPAACGASRCEAEPLTDADMV